MYSRESRLMSLGLLTVSLLSVPRLQAEVLYDVTIIEQPEGAYISTPRAVGPNGEVIGHSLYSPAFIKTWSWTLTTGTTLLPAPPGQSSRYAPMDVNDEGVMAGDGAYDHGVAWTYTPQTGFVMLGTLPGFNASRSPRINNHGDVVGELFDENTVLVPTQAFKWTITGGMTRLFPTAGSSTAFDINDFGMVSGVRDGVGLLVYPDGFEVPIPVPAPYAFARGARLNNVGDVAGVLACTHECNRAFLYTSDGEMILIPIVATRHGVAGVTGDRTVIGSVTQGVARGWRWSADRGTELLQNLIDPALNIQIWDAYGVNEAGQIVASGADLDDSLNSRRMMLLTPIGNEIPGDITGDGDVDLVDAEFFAAVLTGTQTDPFYVSRSDLNGDSAADGLDIPAFVDALIGS